MWNNSSELKKQLVYLEKLKVGIMRQINMLNANKKTIYPTKVYPVADVKPLQINGFPVLQFKYEGALPLFLENESSYEQAICDYYFHATMSAYDYDDLEDYFKEALIIFCNYFEDEVIRDLDNRNGKYIIDALRHSRIIKDDNWQVVSKLDTAFKSPDNSLYVYVVEKDNAIEFLKEFYSNHESYKTTNTPVINKEQFIELRHKELLKEQEKRVKTNKKTQDYKDDFWG